MTVKPTTTINRIHFSDLDPLRFEDFCLCLVYKLARWRKINHLGRLGKDEGIDIEAEEEIKEGYIRSWYIQCKRYKTFKKSDVSSVIIKIIYFHSKPRRNAIITFIYFRVIFIIN